ncbi:MAG: hypothetical protein SGILL_001666, partial [Bacillariaceae sp.]
MTKLQVYQDPSSLDSDGIGAVADSHVTPRKAVSFSTSTKTPNESGAAYRTPFRSSHNRHQSPGVTPTPGKSPKMTVGSFRQSLKTPTPSRGQRPVFGDRNAKENSQNRKPRQGQKFSKSKLKTPQPTKTSSVIRNPGQAIAKTTTSTTPTSASAIRRSLRATIIPGQKPLRQQETRQPKPLSIFDETAAQQIPQARPAGKSRLLSKTATATTSLSSTTTGAFKRLGPPQRVVPKTPNSLLRGEMEVLDSSSSFSSPGDESLLLSPPPGAVWNALNVSENQSVVASTGLVILSPQAAEQVQAWSSTKKNQNNHPTIFTNDHPSPPLPRALSLETPKVDKEMFLSEDDNESDELEADQTMELPLVQYSPDDVHEEHNTNKTVIQKSSRGGVAMDLTTVFSTASDKLPAKQQPLREQIPKSTPLSASLPAGLASRLNAKRRASPKQSSARLLDSKAPRTPIKLARQQPRDPQSKKVNDANRMPVKPSSLSTFKKNDKRAGTSVRNTEHSMPLPRPSSTLLPSERRKHISAKNNDQIFQSKPTEVSNRGGMAFDISFGDEKKVIRSSHRSESTSKDSLETENAITISKTWADKQSESFVGWLNYTFNPDEEERQSGGTVAAGL